MLKSSDFIRLPYPPDLIQAGIAIASRRLSHSSRQKEHRSASLLPEDIAQASVELAVRRYLLAQQIPFDFQETNPFTAPDQTIILLGGRRLGIETKLIDEKKAVQRLLAAPALLLETAIPLPARLLSSEMYSGNDLVLFTFAIAYGAGNRTDLLQRAKVGGPFLCSHVMPETWRYLDTRHSPGQLSLRYAGESTLVIDLFGQSLSREHLVETLTLHPHAWVESNTHFGSVSCLHANAIPTARLEILSPRIHSTYTIMPLQWRNLWVYGQEIILAGYLPLDEMRYNPTPRVPSRRNPRSSWTSQLQVAELRSLPQLLEQIMEWKKQVP